MASRLGGQLIEQRRLARLSQAKLAELSGISIATIKAIERGTTNPKPVTLESLSRGLATDEDGAVDSDAFDHHYLVLARAAGIAPKLPTVADSPEPSPEDRVNEVLARHPNIKVAFAQAGDFDDDDAEMIVQVIEYTARKGAEKRQREQG